jgi:hypothetical protein
MTVRGRTSCSLVGCYRLVSLVAVVAISMSALAADSESKGEKLEAEDFIALGGLSPEQKKAMLMGEIVPFAAEDLTDSNVFAGMTSYFSAPLEAVVAALDEASNAAAGDPGVPATIVTLDPNGPFPETKFGASNRDEAAAILAFSGGTEFNLSVAEISQLDSLGIEVPLDEQELEKFSGAYGSLLKRRVDDYRRGGLAGIAAYDRGAGESYDPAAHLSVVTQETASFLRRYMPQLEKELESYPKVTPREERFLLIKKPRGDRMVYVLVHRLAERDARYTVIVHREYYVGFGYDASQVLIVCLEHGDGTLVTVSTDVITHEVAGFGSSIKHRVGRAKVREAAEGILTELHRRVEPDLRASPTGP